MGDKDTLTPREAMEREKARLLEEAAAKAAAIDRDMAELDRIAAKYGLELKAQTDAPETSAERQNNKLQEDGRNVASLVRSYRNDARSSYRTLRYRTRIHYDGLIKRLIEDCGNTKLADLKSPDISRLLEQWREGNKKIAMGNAMLAIMRILINYGATFLEDGECARISVILRHTSFAKAAPRKVERLTEEQAKAIISAAHKMGLHSIALAQALQFGCGLRQRDVIGEWVPHREAGVSDVIYKNNKWLRGIQWSEIDENCILSHTTSHLQKDIEIDLKSVPMVREELARFGTRLPTRGPVIVTEKKKRPYEANQFRRYWRRVADAAGIPKNIKNMDSHASEKLNSRDVEDATDEPVASAGALK